MKMAPDGSVPSDRKPPKPPKSPSRPSAGRVVFVDYPLSEDERAQIKALVVQADKLMDIQNNWVEGGYTFRYIKDARNACVAVQCYAPDEGSPNSGYALSGRGSSCVKALKQLFFISEALGDSWVAGDKSGRSSEDYDD